MESVRRAGWGVIALKASVFTTLGFTLGEPDERGHLEIFGNREDFERFAPVFVEESVRV